MTTGFFPQARQENLNLPRKRFCFGQPFCCRQVFNKFFFLFILPQTTEYNPEYMEWQNLPFLRFRKGEQVIKKKTRQKPIPSINSHSRMIPKGNAPQVCHCCSVVVLVT